MVHLPLTLLQLSISLIYLIRHDLHKPCIAYTIPVLHFRCPVTAFKNKIQKKKGERKMKMVRMIEGLKQMGIAMMVLAISAWPVSSQITTACTTSMISSFTPCINFITASSGNGSSPTQGCCSALSSIVSSGTDCACLILTGNVPFQLPINRTLAVSLPRACNMAPVSLQCKASASPLPAPGPYQFGPPLSLPPRASPELSSPSPSPLPATSATNPATPPGSSAVPGLRPVLTPSAALRISCRDRSSLLLALVGFVVLKVVVN